LKESVTRGSKKDAGCREPLLPIDHSRGNPGRHNESAEEI
jgi:hypothetical protein